MIRVTVPPADLPAAVPKALCEVAEAMGDAGIELAGPPYTRYAAWGPELVTAEIGFPIRAEAPRIGRVVPGVLPGGRIASIIHVGPFDTIGDTYGLMERHLADLGNRDTGPMWETYWSDPEAQPDPATWRTEILVPVETPED
jgi:effector-binding domain-containing protein